MSKEKSVLAVYTEKYGHRLGDLYGIFFEDLNHAADGGLYAEMVQNRSFEFDYIDNESYNGLTAWKKVQRGSSVVFIHVDSANSINKFNPHYLKMEVNTGGEGAGIKNTGFGDGMAIVAKHKYDFSCFYRKVSSKQVPIEVILEDSVTGRCLGKSKFIAEENEWTKVSFEIEATETCYMAHLILLVKEPLKVELDMVSLFPRDTFMGRKNGLRKDISEMLKNLKPRFMRFPGGCLAHIGSLEQEDRNSMYRWKNTIGSVEVRPSKRNSWNYNQTYGLGFYEFFQFCEDIGAEPLPVISAGCDPHALRAAPIDEMQPWINDALDLIEFANGDEYTRWGKVRADMGHIKPFNMKYIAIGNEEVGEDFFERYKLMSRIIKERYPEIKLIGSSGPGNSGNIFEYGWEICKNTPTDFVDEHFYQEPEWFIANANRYQTYSAYAPRAFLGEYASHGDTYFNAIAEAAFMTGIEKSPGIGLACYAPMLCHKDYINWTPNLIWYDNKNVFGTASYYVQQLFMQNQGDVSLKISEYKSENEYETINLNGGIYIEADLEMFEFKECVVKNLCTEETVSFNAIDKVQKNMATDISAADYEISFTVSKKSGFLDDDLEGRKSFKLVFGMKDEYNKMHWVLNGWQRMMPIQQIMDGRINNLNESLFPIEIGSEYKCRLVIKGARISAYINGKLITETMAISKKQEGIFFSASKDIKSGEIIIKAVNLYESEQEYTIDLQDEVFKVATAKLFQLKNHQLNDKNSFESPTNIFPQVSDLDFCSDITISFPRKSVNILRIKTEQ